MAKINIKKHEIDEIRAYNSECMMNIRTSKKFIELVKRWKKKNKRPVKQLIIYATLKYLINEDEYDVDNF